MSPSFDQADAAPSHVLHITSSVSWAAQVETVGEQPGFTDPSLQQEGFIHCSTIDQFLIPANERFRGRTDLVLLVIEVARLSAPLVYEDCYESGQAFPHVYGTVDIDAVVDVIAFPGGPDGRFTEPEELQAWRS